MKYIYLTLCAVLLTACGNTTKWEYRVHCSYEGQVFDTGWVSLAYVNTRVPVVVWRDRYGNPHTRHLLQGEDCTTFQRKPREN